MSSVTNRIPSADVARWLSELLDALGHAQRALFVLDLPIGVRADAGELFQRIEAAQAEVRALQLSRSIQPRREKPAEWSRFVPLED